MTSNADIHLPAIASGDDHAFARWLALCEDRLRASVMSFASAVDVEVVVQESLLRTWQAAPRIKTDERDNALLRFAIRVARNLAISELRKRNSRPEGHAVAAEALTEFSEDGDVAPIPADPHLRQRIGECREKLPKQPAAALTARLTAFGLRSDHELAESLGMAKNTFLKNFGRARKLLRDCLERFGVKLEVEVR